MARQQKILSILAAFALVFGNVAGWVHVHQHSAGRCCDQGFAELDATTQGQTTCLDRCCVSPLRARALAKQNRENAKQNRENAKQNRENGKQSKNDGQQSVETPDTSRVNCDHNTCNSGHPSPVPSAPHDSSHCSVCQHFLNCRDQAICVAPAKVLLTNTLTADILAAIPAVRQSVVDASHFTRGPPIV